MNRLSVLLLVACIALLASGCGGGGSESANGTTEGPIVIGTANSLTGVLAPFELAINDGMDVAAAEINAAGGVDGRQIEIIHVDAKSDLNLAATAALEVIEKGADVVVPMCDADYGAPGARAANEKGILAITCAGAPGIGRQMIGPLTFNTYTGSPTESAANAEYAYRTMGWRRAYFLCDRALEYTKVVCEAFKTRWKELGGEVAGEDTFLQSDTSIASQVTRLKNAAEAGLRRARLLPGRLARRSRRSAPPTTGRSCSPPPTPGTFWLKPTPNLSNVWVAAVGLELRRRPACRGQRVLPEVREEDRRGRRRRLVSAARLLARPDDREGRRDRRHDRRRGARRRRSRRSRTSRCSRGRRRTRRAATSPSSAPC